MAESLEQQEAIYPLSAFNFRVEVGNEDWCFSKVAGLNREYQTATYRDGLSFIDGELLQRFYVDKYVSVTLEQGTVPNRATLYKWLEQGDARPITIHLCDASGRSALTWRLRRAVPVKLSAPTYDAKTSEVCIDTLEIRAAGIAVGKP